MTDTAYMQSPWHSWISSTYQVALKWLHSFLTFSCAKQECFQFEATCYAALILRSIRSGNFQVPTPMAKADRAGHVAACFGLPSSRWGRPPRQVGADGDTPTMMLAHGDTSHSNRDKSAQRRPGVVSTTPALVCVALFTLVAACVTTNKNALWVCKQLRQAAWEGHPSVGGQAQKYRHQPAWTSLQKQDWV